MSKDSQSGGAPPAARGTAGYGWNQISAALLSPKTLIAMVLLAFIVTRYWLLAEVKVRFSDTIVYAAFARAGVDRGRIAYREFGIEYPPVAWWLMAAPRLVSSERYGLDHQPESKQVEYNDAYATAFHCEAFLADLLCLAMTFLVGGLISRASRSLLPAAYVAITAAQPHLLFDRLDIFLLLLILLSVYCWLRSLENSTTSPLWALASYLLVGLGFSFKIMPILSAPFLLLADWRATRSSAAILQRLAALVLGAVGPFLIQMVFSGAAVFHLFQYHSEREIHLESVWGSLMLLARTFGIPCDVFHSHGGFNMIGPWQPAMKLAAIASAAVAGIGLGLWAIMQGKRFDRRTALDCGYLVLVNSTVLATVFSPQYLIWLLPICFLLALDVVPPRWTLWATLLALMTASLGISSWLFPHHYLIEEQGLLGLTGKPVALSEIRSACLVTLAFLLNACFFFSARITGPHCYNTGSFPRPGDVPRARIT